MNNTFSLDKLVRPNIMAMEPYSSARDEFEGSGSIYLDANENSLGSALDSSYNRYPDPRQNGIRKKLSELKSVADNEIFLGNGSDEAIDLLYRAFCEPGRDKAVIFPPTYGMYKVQASINNTPVLEIPLNSDFSLPVEKIKEIINPSVKMLFVCSPNNPTGNLMPKSSIIEVLKDFKGLVVVDEAYIDFAPEGSSMINEIKNYPNLVVLQTFSKAWGLASLRLGMAFAQKPVIDILNKIKYPYNVNGVTQSMVLDALKAFNKKDMMVNQILSLRDNLVQRLKSVSLVEKIYPTSANFILAKVPMANKVYIELVKQGIIVRNRSSVLLCNNCLRITVGTEKENSQLIKALTNIKIKVPAI